jgi:Arc/MetJ family transcription regulator
MHMSKGITTIWTRLSLTCANEKRHTQIKLSTDEAAEQKLPTYNSDPSCGSLLTLKQPLGLDKSRLDVYNEYTRWRCIMRTNVVIDDELMSRALRSSGCTTKRSAIESGLRLLVQVNSQKKLRQLKGKISWQGDLDEMRRD